MYQRNTARRRYQRHQAHRNDFQSNNVSFRDPVRMNSAVFSLPNLSNEYSTLHQLVGQQTPSTTSSTSSSSSPPANISSIANNSMLPQHLQLLISQHQQLMARHNQINAQQQQQLIAQHHHHRHRRHQSASSRHHRLQQHLLKEKELKLKEKEEEENKRKLTAMDFDILRVRNKPTSSINWDEWEQRLESVQIDPKHTNKLMMDYLLCEGDYDIAMELSKESHTEMDENMKHKHFIDKCRVRSDIKNAINNGDMLICMELLNKYHPSFFMKHADILLELQKQHLIELIHRSKMTEAFSYNIKYLIPQTKLNHDAYGNSNKEREKKKKLLVDIGDIMTLMACRNLKHIPSIQRELLSVDKRRRLSDRINRILMKEDNKDRIVGESLLFENMAKMNYYQDVLMNLGIKHQFERGRIAPQSKVMAYNEENIKKVKGRYPEFGKNNKHRSNNDTMNGIRNWVKLDNKYRLKVKNYLPFAFDTSKCRQFQVKELQKYNVIHVSDK